MPETPIVFRLTVLGKQRFNFSHFQQSLDLPTASSFPVVNPRATLALGIPTLAAQEIRAPERVGLALNGPMMIHRTAVVLPENAIVIWFLRETQAFDRSNVDATAILLNDLSGCQTIRRGKFRKIALCQENIPRLVATAV